MAVCLAAGRRHIPEGSGAMTDYDQAVMRGAALMEAYMDLTGAGVEPAVEDLLVDLLAYRQASRA